MGKYVSKENLTYFLSKIKQLLPSKISDLTNDANYIDKTVNNLDNYYTKNQTYNSSKINSELSKYVPVAGFNDTVNNLIDTRKPYVIKVASKAPTEDNPNIITFVI